MDREYYCKFKKECIKDNCDCMYEEWHEMSKMNISLINRINEALTIINNYLGLDSRYRDRYTTYKLEDLKKVLNGRGSDKE